MALTQNREVDHYVDQEIRTLLVDANQRVFKGALVGLSATGYARPLSAGYPFVGIAYEEINNIGGAAGAMNVRVYTQGDFGLSLAGATILSIGRPVFASDDGTLSLSGTVNSYVGVVQDVVASGEIILRIDPHRSAVKTVIHAVEDVAAGVDIANRAVHEFDRAGWFVAARVVNQSTAAAGINDANTAVVALATGSGTVASITFNTTTAFPAVNTSISMGTLSVVHILPGEVLLFSLTNGTAANPGPFLVEIDYV